MDPKNALVLAPGAAPIVITTPAPALRPNPLILLLQKSRSAATRRTYEDNLNRFFQEEYSRLPDPDAIHAFLAQTPSALAVQLAQHKTKMREAGAAPASVNLRLAAVRALITTGFRFGFCSVSAKGLVDSEKSQSYRDTRGPSAQLVKKLIALPDRTTALGKRDYAMLRLLCDNGLRRAEVCGLAVSDFDAGQKRVSILGKGRTEQEFVTIHPSTVHAIQEYLSAAGHDGALFRNFARRPGARGAALTPDGLDDILRAYGRRLGIVLSAHKLRHYAVTAALEVTGGDVRRVQKFSRHKKLETLMIYDDNRADHQGAITTLLGDLLDE